MIYYIRNGTKSMSDEVLGHKVSNKCSLKMNLSMNGGIPSSEINSKGKIFTDGN